MKENLKYFYLNYKYKFKWSESANNLAAFENNEEDLQKFIFTKIDGFLAFDGVNELMPGGI